ncbi:proteinase-activated receptor 1-like [Siphateles boraxobius]|uniref:proteinase-activated receptor 1-like n=1 Tax=Siphateles boraxobius TaxID=180520 RepID=UPI004064381F
MTGSQIGCRKSRCPDFGVKRLELELVVMGIKIILLSVVMAHTCTTTINESHVSSFEEVDDPIDYNNLSDGLYIWEGPETNGSIGSFYAKEDCIFTPDQAKLNCSSMSISEEAVLFLKGLVVTRVMPSFYIFIILISLPLNGLALVTFTCRIRVKKPAVIYMSNLACVDLLFTLLLPLKIHYQLNASDWVFGEVACRVLTAAYYCYMYCSILLMMCMSVDRLLAVALPIASLTWRSARKAACVCVLVWLLALAGTVPLLSMTQTVKIKDVGVTCHDVLYQTQTYVYLFSILSCLYFFLPLVVTLVSYFTIIYVLSVKSKSLATSSSSDNRRKAVIMVITVLMDFVVCFTPTNGILLYHCVRLATGGNSGEGDSSYVAYLLAVCFGSASVFLDPLLYYYGSSQCRQQIRSMLRREKAKKPTTPSNTQTKSTSFSKTWLAVKCNI